MIETKLPTARFQTLGDCVYFKDGVHEWDVKLERLPLHFHHIGLEYWISLIGTVEE